METAESVLAKHLNNSLPTNGTFVRKEGMLDDAYERLCKDYEAHAGERQVFVMIEHERVKEETTTRTKMTVVKLWESEIPQFIESHELIIDSVNFPRFRPK